MKKFPFFILAVFLFVSSCKEKEQVDLLIHAEGIYTADSAFSMVEAIAITDGKVVSTGTFRDLRSRFKASETLEYPGKFIYPGLIDAHCHFLGFGLDQDELDLKGCISFEDLQERVITYAQQSPRTFIIGRGWNEEEWEAKTRPSNYKLNFLFPNIPVVLQRIDGHAVLANQAALDLAGINAQSIIPGGEIELINGYPTGLLVDKAAEKVLEVLPAPNTERMIRALLTAQNKCFAKGLTTVSDAGLSIRAIQLIDSLQEAGALKMRVYAMANPDREALEAYCTQGPIIKDRLQLRSVKLYCDGALGSRGAWLKEPYCDDSTHNGLPQQEPAYYRDWAEWGYKNGFQINTHCIGDSANASMLRIYGETLNGDRSRRWRIEHAQVVDPTDMSLFKEYGIIPSVQPTHAISDMYMARKRLCTDERLAGAYAYLDLLRTAGMVAFGTDFPVESIDPLGTYYAAILREGPNREVFLPNQKMDAISALRGMTSWAAYANYTEQQTGSLEAGKFADLVVMDADLIKSRRMGDVKVVGTMLNGEWVHKVLP